MRGEVIIPAGAGSPGLILGDDGTEYTFLTIRVHKGAALASGDTVDFVALGGEARDIFMPSAVVAQALPAAPVKPATARAGGAFSYFRGGLTKNYAQFNGRARRAEYFGYNLYWALLLAACVLFDIVVSGYLYETFVLDEGTYLPITSMIYFAATLVPGAAITVRRFHDQGSSGWNYFLVLAPYIGVVVLLVLLLKDSQKQSNKYGVSPKYTGWQPG